jgi:hypothetical protein
LFMKDSLASSFAAAMVLPLIFCTLVRIEINPTHAPLVASSLRRTLPLLQEKHVLGGEEEHANHSLWLLHAPQTTGRRSMGWGVF